MLARIRPAGLVCRLVRQEKHNTRLVNVRYRRGASSSSSSHRPDVVPFGSVVGLLLNDGDCCWTTTRQCFGGDTSQRDTSQRDTSQRRAGRGGGRADASSWTRAPVAAQWPHRTGSAPPFRGAARDAEDGASGTTGCAVRGRGAARWAARSLRLPRNCTERGARLTNIRLVYSRPIRSTPYYLNKRYRITGNVSAVCLCSLATCDSAN